MVAIASRGALRAACRPSLSPKFQHRLPKLPARQPRLVAARASAFPQEVQDVFLTLVDRIEAVEDTTVQTLLHTPLACIPIAVVLVVVGPKAFEVVSKKVGGPLVGILLAWLILAHPSTLINALYDIEHVLEHQPVAVSVLILSIASLLIGPYLAMGAGTIAITSILGGIAVEKGWEAEQGAPAAVPLRTIQVDWQKANSEAQARGVAPPPSLPAPDLTAVKIPELPLPAVPAVVLPPPPPLPSVQWPSISPPSFSPPSFSLPQLPSFSFGATEATPATEATAAQAPNPPAAAPQVSAPPPPASTFQEASQSAPAPPAPTFLEVSQSAKEVEQPPIVEASFEPPSAAEPESSSADEVSAAAEPVEMFADAQSTPEEEQAEGAAASYFAVAPAEDEGDAAPMVAAAVTEEVPAAQEPEAVMQEYSVAEVVATPAEEQQQFAPSAVEMYAAAELPESEL